MTHMHTIVSQFCPDVHHLAASKNTLIQQNEILPKYYFKNQTLLGWL